MKVEWDDDKRRANLAKHGVDFAAIDAFQWDEALTREDSRGDYGERRFTSLGRIEARLHVVVWTQRANGLRLISLRKANKRERAIYDEELY